MRGSYGFFGLPWIEQSWSGFKINLQVTTNPLTPTRSNIFLRINNPPKTKQPRRTHQGRGGENQCCCLVKLSQAVSSRQRKQKLSL